MFIRLSDLIVKRSVSLSEENALWKPLYNLLRNDKARQNNRDENNLFFQFSKWKLNYKSLKRIYQINVGKSLNHFLVEETVGYAETFGNGSSHSKNFLLGFRVSLPKPAILRVNAIAIKAIFAKQIGWPKLNLIWCLVHWHHWKISETSSRVFDGSV